MALLEVKDLHVYYGKIHALKGVSLELGKDQIVTLIGANGAGKSTTLKAISGILGASEGQITYAGEPLRDLAAHHIVGKGIVQVPEGRRIFSRLTVAENLKVGAFLLSDKKWIADAEERVLELFPRIRQRLKQIAGTLSGGEQQMLAIARALMSEPRLLLLDEPSLGLAPLIIKDIFEAIRQLRHSGLTILLVEQMAKQALGVADRAYVLETGLITLEGSGKELLDDPKVKAAYLGAH